MQTPTVKTITWDLIKPGEDRKDEEMRLELTQSGSVSVLRIARCKKHSSSTLEGIYLSQEELEAIYHLGKVLFEQKLDLQQFLPESLRNNLTAE